MEEGRDDVTLTDAQLRLKDALERSQDVKAAVDESRRREADYLGRPLLQGEDDTSESSWSTEEWGVEADVLTGVHDSFHCPNLPSFKDENHPRITQQQIDTTLFGGLDFILNADCDRIDLTGLMVSGDPNSLAEGAQILAELAKSIREPEPALGTGRPSPHASHSRHRYFFKRSSVYELVAEVKEAHKDKEREKYGIFPSSPHMSQCLTRNPSASRVREAKRDVQLMAEHQKRYPLPVRMPKFIEIDPATKNQLRFVDNEWDGTVIDAYSKLTIGFNQHVSQRKASHSGVQNILGGGEVRIDFPNQPRVLLAGVTKEMGQQGATKGDVLTHIQDQDVSGKTVAEIRQLLSDKELDPFTGKLSLVFNAEKSVAEALKRRSMVMWEQTTQ